MGGWRYSGLLVMAVVCAAAPAAVHAQDAQAGSRTQPVAGPVHARGVKVIRAETVPEDSPAPTTPPAPLAPPMNSNAAPVKANAPTAAGRVQPLMVAPVIKACPRPIERPDLVLADAAGFDRALKARLSARRGRVVIDLAQPYAMNGEPSAALRPWLDEVQASGGIVTVNSYCQKGRGAFGDFFKKLMGSGKPKSPYRAARTYDVVLHADALDQRVTQVEFTPRARLQ